MLTLSNTLAARLEYSSTKAKFGELIYWYGPRRLRTGDAIRDEIPAPLLEALEGLCEPLEHYCGARNPREALSVDK